MSRPFVLALTSLALLALTSPRLASAQAPRSSTLFPHQASITEPPNSYGLVRLPLGPEVLATAASDLGDVRVYDASGSEVAYTIDRGDVIYPVSPVGERRAIVPFDAREETTRTAGVTTTRETYRLRPPTTPAYGGTWELVIEPTIGEVVRQVVVRAEPAFGEPREVARTSIFRFARWGNERLAIPLPGVADETLTIEITGEGAALHPSFSLREIDRRVSTSVTVDVPLVVRETRREGTQTVLVLERPRGFRTESITFASSTPSFVRDVEVFATGTTGRVSLGRGGLVRMAGLDVRQAREVRLSDGGNDVLEVRIEDGDSPALTDLTVTAATRVPALLFDGGRAQMLRWGGHRARAPRYDLMSLDIATMVRDRELVTATLGPIEANPDHDDTPALAFAMRAGQAVSAERYTHRAALTVGASHDGLSRFTVPPDMWAAAREDLADLRVVDAENRQWPFVFTAAAGNDELEATVAPATPSETPHRSIHRVTLPVSAMSPTIVRVELPPQLVARLVTVRGRNVRGEEIELGVSNFLSNADAPARVEVSLFGERVTELWLEIDDGDEAPLAIERATLVQSAHEVQLVAPAGEYAVIVGDLDASAARYDVADAWELLAVLETEDATLGELAPNPAFRVPSFFERSGWETIVLSVLLGLVVIVLFVMTLRIARSEGEGSVTTSKETKADDQKADDQKADDQKADDQKADDQKADDQKADDQKADDQKADDQKTDDQHPASDSQPSEAPTTNAPPDAPKKPEPEGSSG